MIIFNDEVNSTLPSQGSFNWRSWERMRRGNRAPSPSAGSRSIPRVCEPVAEARHKPKTLLRLGTGSFVRLRRFSLTSDIYNHSFSIFLRMLSRGFNLERKNYGFLPFLFRANLCLPGYKMTGYTKPSWISNYRHLASSHAEGCPSDHLYIFKHFLNPLVLQTTSVTH